MEVEDSSVESQSSFSANDTGQNKQKSSSDYSPVSLDGFERDEMIGGKTQTAFKHIDEKKKPKDANHNTPNELEVEGGWEKTLTGQLAGLLSDNLTTTFLKALEKLVEIGHTEQLSKWAILKSAGLFNGRNTDAISHVVDGALAYLNLGKRVEFCSLSVIGSLPSLVEYTLFEMIHIVLELRPTLTVMEATWVLLLSELNLAAACGYRGRIPKVSGEGPMDSDPKSKTPETSQSDPNKLGNLIPLDPQAQTFQPETSGARLGQKQKVSAKKHSPGKLRSKNTISLQELNVRLSGVSMDEQSGSPSINFESEFLRQKALHFEKYYRGRLKNRTFEERVAAWESMVLKFSFKSLPGQSGIVIKENPSDDDDNNTPVKDPVITFLVTKSDSRRKIVKNDALNSLKQPTDSYANNPFNKILQNYVGQDKHKALLMLMPLKLYLEKELQGWTDWTNERIMEAARTLGKFQAEFKPLRREIEEIEKAKKEKQAGEERNVKRLTEMEHVLTNANRQNEVGKRTFQRLEVEKSVLKREMGEAWMEARDVGVKVEETLMWEQELRKKFVVGEGDRNLVMEVLNTAKRKSVEFEKQLGKLNNRQNQFKVLKKQVEKEKQKVENHYNVLKEKREKEDDLKEAEANNVIQTGQKVIKKHTDESNNLSSKISELKLESDKLTIAALSVGFGPNVSAGKQQLPQVTDPDMECVMCMDEESLVVFLPCAHKVLCRDCNVLHENQGMSDCPSCRTTIAHRLYVTYQAK